ncbi:unnamed protein product [Adineta ricciae]|uniref:Uncharacterized protein n=1 Tax=Adineta ricciae TaxID=249248 RepID=A0A814CBX5_ADIRI|nr:unnamed protein product [Adineta ricciae]
MSDTRNVRVRHNKSNSPADSFNYPAHFVLSTGDFQSSEKDHDARLVGRNKHNTIQIIFLIFTALAYLIHTLRAYIPETLQSQSEFWSNLAVRPITRVYTTDLRPNVVIESLVYRLAENWQTFWLIYILSYISRRTHFGYLYRNPNIFNSLLCFLFIGALALQTISHSAPSSELSCGCLVASFILLIITCRLVAVKVYRYDHKYRAADLTIDSIILRYFVLNSLFLYTTSVAYSTICAIVEYIGIYLDPNAVSSTSISFCTTIGLIVMFFLLLIYFLLDLFVYEQEFRSIWTPYLFTGYVFICPPLRETILFEPETISNNVNYYLFWLVFSSAMLMVLIRLYRQISLKCGKSKKRIRISSNIEQISS